MNRIVKNMVLSLCGAALLLCIACSFIAGRASRSQVICERLEVVITDSLENSFVSKEDVRKYLEKEYGQYIGVAADSLDLVKIEKIIDNRSAVDKSQAYVTKDGTLHVTVSQRRPVVRFQKKNGGFYADAEGFIFPLQSSFASHVQVIDGNIPLAANSGYKGIIEDPKEKEWFQKVMRLVNFIENDRQWKGKIVQIHVDSKGELILIPREGKEHFLFGQPTGLEDKFSRMARYYTTIIPAKGADHYRKVDLRYEGQIVCR